MAFPGSLVAFAGFVASHTLLVDTHAAQHNLEQSEILAIETKVGTGASTPIASTVLRGNGTGTSTWGQVVATTDITGTLPVANGGTGSTNLTFPGGPDTLVARGSTDTLTNKTLTAPTIGSFTNAQHNHANATGGGQLTGSTALVNSTVTADKLATGAAVTRLVTQETTGSPTYTDLTTTTDTVTVTIGNNGLALVSIYCATIQNDTAADYSLVAFDVSGANTIAAADEGVNMFSLKIRNAAASVIGDWGLGVTGLLTNLSPGSTTFKMKYRVAGGGTGTFGGRRISVVPL